MAFFSPPLSCASELDFGHRGDFTKSPTLSPAWSEQMLIESGRLMRGVGGIASCFKAIWSPFFFFV